jgi:hypothetical protein
LLLEHIRIEQIEKKKIFEMSNKRASKLSKQDKEHFNLINK